MNSDEHLRMKRFGLLNVFVFLTQEPDVGKLEKKINCGQIEEVIFQVGHSTFCSCSVLSPETPQITWNNIVSLIPDYS